MAVDFLTHLFGKYFMPIGDWLRDERKRLGLSQPAFAELAGTTKQTVFSWETGKTAPDAFQLAALAAAGADALYILTGQPSQGLPAKDTLPPDQQVLVSAYERCTAEGKHHLIQTAALLSAGMPVAPATSPKRRAKADQQEHTQHAMSGECRKR